MWESDPFSYSGRRPVPHAALCLSVNPSSSRPAPWGPDFRRQHSSSLRIPYNTPLWLDLRMLGTIILCSNLGDWGF